MSITLKYKSLKNKLKKAETEYKNIGNEVATKEMELKELLKLLKELEEMKRVAIVKYNFLRAEYADYNTEKDWKLLIVIINQAVHNANNKMKVYFAETELLKQKLAPMLYVKYDIIYLCKNLKEQFNTENKLIEKALKTSIKILLKDINEYVVKFDKYLINTTTFLVNHSKYVEKWNAYTKEINRFNDTLNNATS